MKRLLPSALVLSGLCLISSCSQPNTEDLDLKSGTRPSELHFQIEKHQSGPYEETDFDFVIKVLDGPLAGYKVTTLDPLQRQHKFGYYAAQAACSQMYYGNIYHGWRLPTKAEALELHRLGYALLGYQAREIKISSNIWFDQEFVFETNTTRTQLDLYPGWKATFTATTDLYAYYFEMEPTADAAFRKIPESKRSRSISESITYNPLLTLLGDDNKEEHMLKEWLLRQDLEAYVKSEVSKDILKSETLEKWNNNDVAQDFICIVPPPNP